MEQMTLDDFLSPKYKIKKPIRLIELFAGIGSQAKALENLKANFEHYKVCEFDEAALKSYNEIHNTNFNTSDITKINGSDLEIKETNKYEYILTYSFPCQSLSNANTTKNKGMTKGSGTKSSLLWEVERLLNETEELPQVLLMENVPDVINKLYIDSFKQWLKFLESKGYNNFYKILDASKFEIPQVRRRCFMISILGNYSYCFPKEMKENKKLIDFLENNVDDKYYLTKEQLDKTIAPIKNCYKDRLYIKDATRKGYKEAYFGDGIYYANIKGKRGMVQSQRIQTIKTTKDIAVIMHDLRARTLTSKEAWRLMGFNDNDYNKAIKVNNEKDLYKQAGNSIVVNVLMAIFSQLL